MSTFFTSTETQGRYDDQSTRVGKEHTLSGGKYRCRDHLVNLSLNADLIQAIVKLYLGYVNRPGQEYAATGWLIANDLVVTAGHYVYDWQNKGGHLKYAKAYIGYSGPESITGEDSEYEQGVFAAAPVEYLKAASRGKDVGFVSVTSCMISHELNRESDPAFETFQRRYSIQVQ